MNQLVPPAALQWVKTLAVILGALLVYITLVLILSTVIGDPVAGSVTANGLMLSLAVILRRHWLPRLVQEVQDIRGHQLSRTKFWVFTVLGLLICWLGGQVASVMVYSSFGSAGFDAHIDTQLQTPAALLLIAAVIFAPMGEEALMRGVAYPMLRRHWPPLAAAFCSSMIFAILHGNIVQVVLTVPLGILLAFVYEETQRLREVILLHAGFNALSIAVPAAFITTVASWPLTACLLLLIGCVLVALHPTSRKEA